MLRIFLLALLTACGSRTGLHDAPDSSAPPEVRDAAVVGVDAAVRDAGCAIDVDGDGHLSPACGGDDCDDADPTVFPGAPDPGAAWQLDVIDPEGFSQRGALAVDGDGVVHVAYENNATSTIEYARGNLGDWQIEVAQPNHALGRPPAIALAADGTVHLVYAESRATMHAWRTEEGWEREVADWGVPDDIGSLGDGASLAVDVDAALHVSFTFDDEVRYATTSTGAWTVETAYSDVGGAGGDTSIVVDELGSVWIASNTAGLLLLTRTSAGHWRHEPLSGASASLDMRLDAAGALHIVDDSDARLTHYSNEMGDWTSTIVDSDSGTSTPTLAIGPDGALHVAYAHGASEIWYATLRDDLWTGEPIDVLRRHSWTSIGTDPDGGIHVAYWNQEEQDLSYAFKGPDTGSHDCRD